MATIHKIPDKSGAMARARLLRYDTSKYRFADVFKAILKIPDISRLHLGMLHQKREKEGPEAKLDYRDSRKLRDWISMEAERVKFYEVYELFMRHVICPYFNLSITYAQRPRFRVHLAGGPSVSDWHRDTDITARYDQITAWVPAVDCEGTNSLWVESDYNKGDFQPVTVKYGEILLFDGALVHGSVANETDVTRIGFDVRFAPKRKHEGADLGILGGREGKLVIPENPQPVQNPGSQIKY